ncbi:MAG: uroporphyrinogen-III synthase, partial [Pseudomonadales bacterium]|nr:uroporphyrinogen-III synthase [Pseudomonadales bacterium]
MKVWISRSRPGADRHEQVLQAAGFETLVLPVLAIDSLSNPAPGRDFNLVIFLSEHAVNCSSAQRARTDFCAGAQVLAVGTATAAALTAAGVSVSVSGDRRGARLQGSERLLASTALQEVKGQSILIVCGEGGRMLLADTLRRRGADVQLLRCYRRRPAGIRLESTTDIDAILVGSG